MAKTIGASLQAEISGGSSQLVKIIKITREDGNITRLTDHDQPIVVPSDGTYLPTTSFIVTSISSNITEGSSAAEIEIQFGNLSGQVAKADVRAGLYRNAKIEVDVIAWENPSYGKVNLFTGWIGPFVGYDTQKGTAQLLGFSQKALNRIGEKYAPECRATLGDARCGINRASYSTTGTVSSVTSGYDFRATFAVNPAADVYTLGIIEWSTGNNAGLKMEIIRQDNYDATDDRVLLAQAMPYDIQVGDTFTAFQGCDKRPTTCTTKFNNILNFRGEPFVPGPDFISDKPEPL